MEPAQEGRPQVVGKVAAVLTALAREGAAGRRLLDLADETGLARPTVHRILRELAAAGFVEQRPGRRYGLGPALYLLGLGAPSPIRDHDAVRQVAQELAGRTGDTVYVAIRRLDGVHYLTRADGGYPIRAEIVEVGETVPLGVTYAGIALLAWHEPERVEAQVRANAALRRLMRFPVAGPEETLTSVRRQITQVREYGYCFDKDTVMPGVSGMAAPVPSAASDPYLAITLSGVNDRLPAARIRDLAPQLLEAAGELARYIA
ncbi:IclR family transcriptional regulator [Streptomyces lichenis]|uniref:IclR family transcriptional regulator n=1 Tax=Streptomyces lichenis TaxID=2306967 RepID=A0ABT0IJI3_9ACTN|nr:IclR family transcriptional regulator [Streptomyces lichenis]MCK8681435.1 IclR family transcriptional regulator [Streptomyces lichenis]